MDKSFPADLMVVCDASVEMLEQNATLLALSFSGRLREEPVSATASISSSDAVVMAQDILTALVAAAREIEVGSPTTFSSSLRRAARDPELSQVMERSFAEACARTFSSTAPSPVPDAWARLLRFILEALRTEGC
jgi:hypothetical protein